MNARLTTHTLELLIATSSPTPQMLSSLVAHQFVGSIVPNQLTLTITVAPATSVIIIDDLGGTSAETVDHSIELVLNRDSTLNYRVQTDCHTNVTPRLPGEALREAWAKAGAQDTLDQARTKAWIPAFAGMTNAQTYSVIKNITVRLIDAGAQANIRYDCYGTESKTFSIKTLQDHQAPHTTSSVTIKGVFDDQASLNTHNTIRIHKAAQHANATQSNKNILLSKDAHVITTPQLEIEAHDVKCKHGAAVSQLNQDDLFYLQSRGLDSMASRNLLIKAFLF